MSLIVAVPLWQVAHAGLKTIAQMDQSFPQLGGIVDDPEDPDKIRFLVALGDAENKLYRVRAITFKTNVAKWKSQHTKQMSALYAGIVEEGLIDVIENLKPDLFDP